MTSITPEKIHAVFTFHEDSQSWLYTGDNLDKIKEHMRGYLGIWEGMYDVIPGVYMVTALNPVNYGGDIPEADLDHWDIYGKSTSSNEEAWRYLIGAEFMAWVDEEYGITQDQIDRWAIDFSPLF